MKRAGIICVLILMSLFRASGQEVFHLGTEEGLGGRQTFSVVRDRKGFIWISTRFGVDRYDGHDFKHYPVSILSKDKSPIRSIYLEMDRDSLLWAYTDNGTIYRYQESVDGFELYADLEHWIGTVHFDRYGRLWVAGKALFGYFDTEGKFVHADNEKARGADIRKLIDRNDSEMIIVAVDRIVCMDMNTSRTEFLVPQDRIQELGTRIETAFLDGDRLWIGTSGKGLFRLDGNSGNLEKMTGRLLDEHPVLTINMDSHGRLLLGTDGMGLCIYDREQDDIVSVFNKSANPPFRIAGDAVYGIYPSDRHEGEIWIATFSDGVNVIEEDSSPFHMLSMGGGHRRSRQACCLIETGDGSLWVATDNDIKVRVPGQDGWRTMLHGRNVLSLHEDAHGNIWAGTYSSGLYRLDRDGNILQHYIHGGENTIGTDYVYTIAEDIYGRIWTGGKKGRVSVLDPLTGRFSRVGVAQANHIVRYDDNTMLIASEDGVYMCHVDDLKAVPCPFNDNLYSQYVCDIAIGRDSTLWLATYGNGVANRLRLMCFNDSMELAGQFFYEMDKPTARKKPRLYAFGVSEVCPVGRGRLLVMEREFFVSRRKLGSWVNIKIYVVSPTDSLKGETLPKYLLTEFKTRLNLFRYNLANYEGMCLGPRLADGNRVVILVSDSQNRYGGVLKDYFKTIVISDGSDSVRQLSRFGEAGFLVS